MKKSKISLQKSALSSWKEEMRSAYLYRKAAKKEKNKTYSRLFATLAEEAEKQAEVWNEELKKSGGQLPHAYQPDMRAKIVAALIYCFGVRATRTILAAMKVRGMSLYIQPETGHPMPKSLAEVGLAHAGVGSGNNLRAAVFGVNDGLVSNASLIMGMVGAHASNNIIILTGVAGLLAGAFSMSAGEYISVRSQREMFEYQIGLEKKELELYPAEETEELALIYAARGLSKSEAREVAALLMRDPKHALDILAKEELGLNPAELGSPLSAALFSFCSFLVGAMIPLLPFLFGDYKRNLPFAIILSGLSLLIIGATLSLFTGRSALKGGLRMLLIGAGASCVTYLIGSLLGVTLV